MSPPSTRRSPGGNPGSPKKIGGETDRLESTGSGRALQLELDLSAREPSLDDLVREGRRALAEMGEADLAVMFSAEWNPRLSTTAGTAHCWKLQIRLNPKLKNHPGETRQTFLHELAHLLAFHRHGGGIQSHGREWKLACADLGIPGESRCHDLPWSMPVRWVGICPSCAKRSYRRRRGDVACGKCCRRLNRGKFSKRFKLTWHPVEVIRGERGGA